MSTLAPPELVKTADEWEALADYPSAVCSGIVGDPAHKRRGGYHISIEDQPSDNYSVVRVDDKAPPGDWRRDYASAIDMNLNAKDMKLCHGRIRSVWMNRRTDPRAKYFNAWNGWDGNGSPGRYSFVTGAVEEASGDHTWHIHMEPKRKYANSPAMRRAWISIVKGESVIQYLGKEEAMAYIENQAQFNTAFNTAFIAALKTDSIRAAIGDAVLDSKTGNTAYPGRVLRQFVNDQWGKRDYEIGDPKGTSVSGVTANSPLAQAFMGAKAVPGLTTMLTNFVKDEVTRDAQEASRDAAMTATIQQMNALLEKSSGALTEEQFNALRDAIVAKVAEAGQDAADEAARRLDQIVEALDNAGEVLTNLNDGDEQQQ